jgi:two-component sensor histidine kinase
MLPLKGLIAETSTKRFGHLDRKAIDLAVCSFVFCAIGLAFIFRSFITASVFRPFYAFAVILALLAAIFSLRGRYLVGLRLAEFGISIILTVGCLMGMQSGWGAYLAFIPALGLFCRYFDGPRALIYSSGWSAATFVAWYLMFGHRTVGVDISLNYAECICFALVLTALVGQVLDFAVLNEDLLLNELHHRVRNFLQIIQSLATMSCVYGILDPVRFRMQMAALHDLQASVASGGSYRTIDLGPLLEKLAARVNAALDGKIVMKTRVGGRIPFENTSPLVVLLVDLLKQQGSEPGVARLEVTLDIGGEISHLRLEAFSSDGNRLPVEPDFDDIDLALLSQLRGEPGPEEAATGWHIQFGSSTTASFLDKQDLANGEESQRIRKNEWVPLLGKKNLGRSHLWLRKTRHLAYFCILLALTLVGLILVSIVSGTFRFPALALVLCALGSYLLVLAGHFVRPAILITLCIGVTMSWAIMGGPNHELGSQLLVVEPVILVGLYFLDLAGGISCIAWSVAIYALWFAFYGQLALPLDAFLTFAAALLLFAILAVLEIRACKDNIYTKQALVLSLRRLSLANIELLQVAVNADLSSCDGADRLPTFMPLLDTIAEVHSIVWKDHPDPVIEMRPLIKIVLSERKAYEGFFINVELNASGSLPTERAVPALILISELRRLASSGHAKQGRLRLTFDSGEREAKISAEAADAGGVSVNFLEGCADSILSKIESQLEGFRQISTIGAYVFTFGV